jgi:hypothetical protein
MEVKTKESWFQAHPAKKVSETLSQKKKYQMLWWISLVPATREAEERRLWYPKLI